MLLTLKTIPKVNVGKRVIQEEYAYMDIQNVKYDGDIYTSFIEHYYFKEVDSGLLDENDQPIMRQSKQSLGFSAQKFTKAQAQLIEQSFGIPLAMYLTEKLEQTVYCGAMYQLSEEPLYETIPSQWVVVPKV